MSGARDHVTAIKQFEIVRSVCMPRFVIEPCCQILR